MTAKDIIDMALSISGESPEDFQNMDICIKWLNMTLAESMSAENMIRQKEKRQLLTKPFIVDRLSDSVDMNKLLCEFCLPLGLAAYVYADKENERFYSEYRKRFLDSLGKVAGIQEMTITDCYGAGVVRLI